MGYHDTEQEEEVIFLPTEPPTWEATGKKCPQCEAQNIMVEMKIVWIPDGRKETIKFFKCPVCSWQAQPVNKEDLL